MKDMIMGVCMLHVRVGVCVGIRYMYELSKKTKPVSSVWCL